MKILTINVILVVPLILNHVGANVDAKSKNSRGYGNPFGGSNIPKFISFDSGEGQIDIDWDVTIPFISIPLNHEHGENGEVPSLLNVNTKALGIAGLVTTILTFIVPLFVKPTPGAHYRSNEDTEWSQIGTTINEMVFGNNYVAPCMQRIVCSIVSIASHSENPTSTDKIIDGLSSHKWFKDATNGTIIQDAVLMGRKGDRNCSHAYKDCLITPKLLKSLMSQFGII